MSTEPTRCQCGSLATDSVGSEHGLCQDCWEKECGESWWQMVELLPVEEKPEL